MAGEMRSIDPYTGQEPDGTVWPLHAAIAKAVGGTVQPFDQYQGPYILIWDDGAGSSARLWVDSDDNRVGCVWREDTGLASDDFLLSDTQAGIDAALSLTTRNVQLVECGSCGCMHEESFYGDCRDDDNRYDDEEDFSERTGVPLSRIDVTFLIDRESIIG